MLDLSACKALVLLGSQGQAFLATSWPGLLKVVPVEWQFEDDVYIATSEPHGDIEATITRGNIEPHCKL